MLNIWEPVPHTESIPTIPELLAEIRRQRTSRNLLESAKTVPESRRAVPESTEISTDPVTGMIDLGSSSYIILNINDKRKWIAMFQDYKPSVNMQALFGSIVDGGAVLTRGIVSQYFGTSTDENSNQQLHTDPSQTTDAVNNATPNKVDTYAGVAGLSLPVATFDGLKAWLSTHVSQYKKNIEGCMLKKLEGFMNESVKE
ncbi:unnamed protein product [Adineta ricciae]|uniref:Uncharacterized protein n=1 Tax=Adineta ricciae TaxID=249248 RepID=A0A815UW85_ADIRI|nr:unnamed protein product [Adineta ricciae]CAF1522621.1 unnamed protein product [Adineta ricciae]